MLFTHRSLTTKDRMVIDRISKMRSDLRYHVVQNPRKWSGLLARMTRARALRASNSIEDIHVSAEDALAVIDNEEVSDANKETFLAVKGYHNAMDYVLQRCRNDNFTFSEEMILSIHFMICQHDLEANPGNYRRGSVNVYNTRTGDSVHEGVQRDKLEPLMQELVKYINSDNVESTILKGAMAHLNLTMLHPFSDGNGRTARCLQSAVLADQGIMAPEFASIESYIGRNQQDYYDVLAKTGNGGWFPKIDCTDWVKFCIVGHYREAQSLQRKIDEFGALYSALVEVVSKKSLPERMALGLLHAAIGYRLKNSSYRISAEVSNNLASRDLKTLVDSGLLVAAGEKRGRYYVGTEQIKELRNKTRKKKIIDDPYEDIEVVGPIQQSFFDK